VVTKISHQHTVITLRNGLSLWIFDKEDEDITFLQHFRKYLPVYAI